MRQLLPDIMGSAVAGCQHVTKKFKDVDIVRTDSSTGQGPCGQGWLAHCRLDAFNRSTIYVAGTVLIAK
jgi:hypothetical protein